MAEKVAAISDLRAALEQCIRTEQQSRCQRLGLHMRPFFQAPLRCAEPAGASPDSMPWGLPSLAAAAMLSARTFTTCKLRR